MVVMDKKHEFYKLWQDTEKQGWNKTFDIVKNYRCIPKYVNAYPILTRITRKEVRKYITEFKNQENIKLPDTWNYVNGKPFDQLCMEQPKQPTKEEILKKLEKGININDADSTTLSLINNLVDEGYNVSEFNNIYKLQKDAMPSYESIDKVWNGDKIIRFGVCGDNQLCSVFSQLTFLHKLYDIYQNEGITTVYNPGDISEGYKKTRAGHIYDLIPGCVGVDQQKDYIVKNFPERKDITTEFITGNHDHWHIQNGGANIGKMIERERSDMKYLGLSNIQINITPNCIVELNHPEDGSAYALSYSSQKYADSLMGGNKPNILLQGHYHKAEYIFYRNIHIVQSATTCAQTNWMRAKKLAAHVGGWIIEVHVNDDGTITRFKSEFIPLYYMKKNDY